MLSLFLSLQDGFTKKYMKMILQYTPTLDRLFFFFFFASMYIIFTSATSHYDVHIIAQPGLIHYAL